MVVLSPSIARAAGRAYLASSGVPHEPSEGASTSSALVFGEIGGRTLTPPPGRHDFVAPLLFADRAGGVRMVWGDKDTTDRADSVAGSGPSTPNSDTARNSSQAGVPGEHRSAAGRVRALWSARYTPRDGWDAPKRILVAPRGLSWARGRLTPPLVTSDGSVHLAAGSPEGPVYLGRFGDRWHVGTLRIGEAASFAAVAPSGSGTLAMVYVRRRQLLATASYDRGRTWSGGAVLDSTTAGVPRHPQLVVASGRVHLLWGHAVGALASDAIRHVRLATDGAAWEPVGEVSIGSLIAQFRAVADGCGAIRLLYQPLPVRGSELSPGWVRWAGRWGAPAPLRLIPAPTSPELHVDAAGVLTLLYVGRDSRDSTGAVTTWYAHQTIEKSPPTGGGPAAGKLQGPPGQLELARRAGG